MQPNSSKMKPMPKEVVSAAAKADASVGADVAAKVLPMLEDYTPQQRKALMTASAKLVSKITGQPLKTTGTDADMQYLALAIAALNTYRGTRGQEQLDINGLDAMMLISVIEEAMADPEFFDYIGEQMDGSEGMADEGMEESMMEEEDGEMEEDRVDYSADKKRRNMFKGAM